MPRLETWFRRTLLLLAVACWTATIVLGWLIIDGDINQLKHPGVGLFIFIGQGLAITFTILWGQFRVRRIAAMIMKAGVRAGVESGLTLAAGRKKRSDDRECDQ